MRYNDNYACANVTTSAPKSDTAVQREYFLNSLQAAEWPKQQELVKLFNLNADNTPKNFKQLIDAIKNDKFKINKKVAKRFEMFEEDKDEDSDEEFNYSSPLYGIEWDGPKADYDGYSEATNEKSKQFKAAEASIMAGDAAAMKKAVEDFVAWVPATAAN